MLIRGEVQIDTFTFGFTVHGSRGDWKMTISAPVFPATVTTEECLPVAMRALVARDFRGVRSSARPDDEAAKVAEG